MLNRRLKFALSSFGLACLLAVPGSSQQAPRIAGVDLQRTFEQSAEGKSVISQLRQREQAILGELDKLDQQISSLETKLKTQALALTAEAQQQLAFDLDTTRLRRKRTEEDATKDFQRLQFNLINKLRTEVLSVVEDYAKENQISLVFDLSSQGGLLYCESGLDITAEIVKRYDSSKAGKR